MPTRAKQRLDRQFEMLGRRIPRLSGLMARMQARHAWYWRLPLGVLLCLGGVLSFLPFLGIWMLPLGLMLLAIDIPALRGPVACAIVRLRRRFGHLLPGARRAEAAGRGPLPARRPPA